MECDTCSVVSIYQHFRGACYLFHQSVKVDEAGSLETSVSIYQSTQCLIWEERICCVDINAGVILQFENFEFIYWCIGSMMLGR
jgi:hypothetical protein